MVFQIGSEVYKAFVRKRKLSSKPPFKELSPKLSLRTSNGDLVLDRR